MVRVRVSKGTMSRCATQHVGGSREHTSAEHSEQHESEDGRNGSHLAGLQTCKHYSSAALHSINETQIMQVESVLMLLLPCFCELTFAALVLSAVSALRLHTVLTCSSHCAPSIAPLAPPLSICACPKRVVSEERLWRTVCESEPSGLSVKDAGTHPHNPTQRV